MQEAQNTTLIREAYAAFLRQDLNALLATFDEQIVCKPVTGAAG